MSILKSPGRHLLHRPLGGSLMIGRAGEPGTENVSEHMHRLHDLGIVLLFLTNAFEQIFVIAVLGQRGQAEKSGNQTNR